MVQRVSLVVRIYLYLFWIYIYKTQERTTKDSCREENYLFFVSPFRSHVNGKHPGHPVHFSSLTHVLNGDGCGRGKRTSFPPTSGGIQYNDAHKKARISVPKWCSSLERSMPRPWETWAAVPEAHGMEHGREDTWSCSKYTLPSGASVFAWLAFIKCVWAGGAFSI